MTLADRHSKQLGEYFDARGRAFASTVQRHDSDWPVRLDAIGFSELVRFDGAVQAVSRAVIADTELSGRLLRRGDVAVAVIASANRDVEAFDNADSLVLDRADKRPSWVRQGHSRVPEYASGALTRRRSDPGTNPMPGI